MQNEHNIQTILISIICMVIRLRLNQSKPHDKICMVKNTEKDDLAQVHTQNGWRGSWHMALMMMMGNERS